MGLSDFGINGDILSIEGSVVVVKDILDTSSSDGLFGDVIVDPVGDNNENSDNNGNTDNTDNSGNTDNNGGNTDDTGNIDDSGN